MVPTDLGFGPPVQEPPTVVRSSRFEFVAVQRWTIYSRARRFPENRLHNHPPPVNPPPHRRRARPLVTTPITPGPPVRQAELFANVGWIISRSGEAMSLP
jgi:hypothetical protein